MIVPGGYFLQRQAEQTERKRDQKLKHQDAEPDEVLSTTWVVALGIYGKGFIQEIFRNKKVLEWACAMDSPHFGLRKTEQVSPKARKNIQIKNWQINAAKKGKQITSFFWQVIFLERNTKGTGERMTAATNISLVIYSLKNTFAYPSIFETMENKAKRKNHYEMYFSHDKEVNVHFLYDKILILVLFFYLLPHTHTHTLIHTHIFI